MRAVARGVAAVLLALGRGGRWVLRFAAVTVVTLAVAAGAGAIDGRPLGAELAQALVCAARGDCDDGDDELRAAYGDSDAALVREYMPNLVYEPRTRTLPVGGTRQLRMAVVSCSNFAYGYFNVYRRLAERADLDMVVHLGDYLYEYKKDSYVIGGGNPRDHQGPETTTLQGYRQRHAQYKSDADLQAAHATAPWLVVWDDHEVDNNWADEVPENRDAGQLNDTTERFRQRRAAAFQAYYENMPLRRAQLPHGPDAQLYRRLNYGRLAQLDILDSRQYRDDQALGDCTPPPGGS